VKCLPEWEIIDSKCRTGIYGRGVIGAIIHVSIAPSLEYLAMALLGIRVVEPILRDLGTFRDILIFEICETW
jgi:hypothetical protein